MSLSVTHLLTLAGRLDDTPGFDSARERFRRFLREHVTTPAIARALIEEAQHTPGDQHRRALQDLVTVCGRFLGFDVTFGSYEPVSGALKLDGQWTSRGRLQAIIDVRSVHSTGDEPIDGLVRSVAAAATVSGVRTIGLCITTSRASSRKRIAEAIAATPNGMTISLPALDGLLGVAELATAGTIAHAEAARLLESRDADLLLDVLQRTTITAAAPTSDASLPPATLPVADEPRYWIASVVRDYATRPEEFLEMVVGRRKIFGITQQASAPDLIARNDWICFYIAGKGVVGHAQVTSPADARSMRDGHRYRQLVNIEDVSLYLSAPIAVDAGTELRLRGAPAQPHAQVVERVTRAAYVNFTTRPTPRTATGVSERRRRSD